MTDEPPKDLSPRDLERVFAAVRSRARSWTRDDSLNDYPSHRRRELMRTTRRNRSPPDKEAVHRDAMRLMVSRRGNSGEALAEKVAHLDIALASTLPHHPLGRFLSVVRTTLDLEDTAVSFLTSFERRALHLLQRRLTEDRSSARPGSADEVSAVLETLMTREPRSLRAICDLLRFLEETTRQPLLAWPTMASLEAVHLVISLTGTARRHGADARPLDALLGARMVLANQGTFPLRAEALLDGILDEGDKLCSPLKDWLGAIPNRSDDGTLLLSTSGVDSTFQIDGRVIGGLDLALEVGRHLLRLQDRQGASSHLEALERSIARRVLLQEGIKHHAVVLLRRGIDKLIQARLNDALRPRLPSQDRPPTVQLPLVTTSVTRDRLAVIADHLERGRTHGCGPEAPAALLWLDPHAMNSDWSTAADCDEWLRVFLDVPGSLTEMLETLDETKRIELQTRFSELRKAAFEHDRRREASIEKRSRRLQRQVGRTTPLQIAQALEVWQSRDNSTGASFGDALLDWQLLMPWDPRLHGVWPTLLRGQDLASGLRAGVRDAEASRFMAIEARLALLERELTYRCWLGAHARVRLLRATFPPPPVHPQEFSPPPETEVQSNT